MFLGAWAVQWAPIWVGICYMVAAVLVLLWAMLQAPSAKNGDAARYRKLDMVVIVATVASILALLIMQAIGHGAWHPPHIAPIAFMFAVLYGSLALRRVP